MPICITLTSDLKVHSRERLPKGQKPLNGFQRQKNHTYVKILGDPRCVSFEERRRELELQEKFKPQPKVEEQSPPPLPRPFLPVGKQVYENPIPNKPPLFVKSPITMEKDTLLFHFFSGYKETRDSNKIVLFGPKPSGMLGIPELDNFTGNWLKKVEILLKDKSARFWIHNSTSSLPDLIVTDILE
jgi:hypothetical protein